MPLPLNPLQAIEYHIEMYEHRTPFEPIPDLDDQQVRCATIFNKIVQATAVLPSFITVQKFIWISQSRQEGGNEPYVIGPNADSYMGGASFITMLLAVNCWFFKFSARFQEDLGTFQKVSGLAAATHLLLGTTATASGMTILGPLIISSGIFHGLNAIAPKRVYNQLGQFSTLCHTVSNCFFRIFSRES